MTSMKILFVQNILLFIMMLLHVAAAGKNNENTPCLEFFKPEHIKNQCCQFTQIMLDNVDPECRVDKDSRNITCEDSKCRLEKFGLIKEDTINEDAFNDLCDVMDDNYPEGKRMSARVKRACLGGRFKKYPPEDACDAIKFQICVYINSMVECPWKETDGCDKLPVHAEKCKTYIDDNMD